MRGRALPLVALIVLATGCAKRATHGPNAQGGYTLLTTVNNLEQAMVRFKRSAEDLCPGSYRFTPAEIVDRGVAGPLGTSSTVTVRTELTCE